MTDLNKQKQLHIIFFFVYTFSTLPRLVEVNLNRKVNFSKLSKELVFCKVCFLLCFPPVFNHFNMFCLYQFIFIDYVLQLVQTRDKLTLITLAWS